MNGLAWILFMFFLVFSLVESLLFKNEIDAIYFLVWSIIMERLVEKTEELERS